MTTHVTDHNILWSSYERIPPAVPTDADHSRFWVKVEQSNPASCWLWKGPRDRLGYGQFTFAGKPRRAHRMAYFLTHGVWYDPHVKLRHTCDNRQCCNPAHLLPGTQADNMRDRWEREGYATIRGPRHHKARLTVDDVAKIRQTGMRICDVVRAYGVSNNTASSVIHGRTWRGVG